MLQSSKSVIKVFDPSARATQLIPTTGSKLTRIIARKLSCSAMKSAIGGEYL
jgi:hypothetical protein